MAFTETDVRRMLGTMARTVMPGSVLGIDIGTSAIKIVQLHKEAGGPLLDTYGMVELGPYSDLPAGDIPRLGPELLGSALMDLFAAVAAKARRGGVSVPLTSAFISTIQTPVRDDEQMRRIMPVEAKPYIPVPLEEVTLDWRVLDAPHTSIGPVLEQSDAHAPEPLQRVLLVAIRNDTLAQHQAIAARARLLVPFYEVESFSAARTAGKPGESTLCIDFGASATKIYAVDERGEPTAAHLIARGGVALTRRIMEEQRLSFADAETLKRSTGLLVSSTARHPLERELSMMLAEAKRVADAYEKEQGRKIGETILAGGGALLPGLEALARATLEMEVRLATPLSHVGTPMILADVFESVGPLYTVATGLALRALG